MLGFPLIFNVLCSVPSYPADLKQCFYQMPLLLGYIPWFPIIISNMFEFLWWLSRPSITWLHTFYLIFASSSLDKLALNQSQAALLPSNYIYLLLVPTVCMFFFPGILYSRSISLNILQGIVRVLLTPWNYIHLDHFPHNCSTDWEVKVEWITGLVKSRKAI